MPVLPAEVNVTTVDFWVDPWLEAANVSSGGVVQLLELSSPAMLVPQLQVSLASSAMTVVQGDAVYSVPMSASSLSSGWMHVAISLGAPSLQVWINGTQVATTQSSNALLSVLQNGIWIPVPTSQVLPFSSSPPLSSSSSSSGFTIVPVSAQGPSCVPEFAQSKISAASVALVISFSTECSVYNLSSTLSESFPVILFSNSSMVPINEAPSLINHVGYESTCVACDASAFDRDVATTWTGCTLQYSFVQPVNASHYAMVYSGLTSGWTLYASLQGADSNPAWVPLDMQHTPSPTATLHEVDFFQILTLLPNALQYKVVFERCPVVIEEFGLFSLPADIQIENGPLSNSTFYYSAALQSLPTGPPLSSYVASTKAVISSYATLLSLTSPRSSFVNTQQITLGSSGFVGLLDEVRLWSVPVTPSALHLEVVSWTSSLPNPAVLYNFDDSLQLPSRARAWSGYLVYATNASAPTLVTLTGVLASGAIKILGVKITSQPSYGTLTSLQILHPGGDQTRLYGTAAVATVLYKAAAPSADFVRDSFAYQVSYTTGRATKTVQATVVLVAAVDFAPIPSTQNVVLPLNQSTIVQLPAVPSLLDNSPILPSIIQGHPMSLQRNNYSVNIVVSAPNSVVWKYPSNNGSVGTINVVLGNSDGPPLVTVQSATSPLLALGPFLLVPLNVSVSTDFITLEAPPALGILTDSNGLRFVPRSMGLYFTAYVSGVVRVSSQTSSLVPDTCSLACERWRDSACLECLTLYNTLAWQDAESPAEMIGEVADGRCFRFAANAPGRQFVEVELSSPIVAQSLRVFTGGSPVSSGLVGVSLFSSLPLSTSCGPTGLPAVEISRVTPSCAVWPLTQADDCADPQGATLAWSASCPPLVPSNGILELALCPQSAPVTALRLDFDSSFWAASPLCIDAIVVVGTDSSTTTGVRGTNLIYTPLPGVFGSDLFTLGANDCPTGAMSRSNVAVTIPMASATWNLGHVQGPDNSSDTSNSAVGSFNLVVDWTVVMDALALNLYGVPHASQVAWPLNANLAVQLVAITSPNGVNLLPNLTPSRVHVGSRTLDWAVAFPVSVPFDAFSPFGYVVAWSILTISHPASASFNLSVDVYLSCPSSSLGLCSAGRTGFIPSGVCTFGAPLGYSCTCQSPVPAVVVAGDACQYNSLETCYGRGDPDATGSCLCYQPKLFGGPQCRKRFKPAATLSELVVELQQTASRIDSRNLSVVVVVDQANDSVQLVDAVGNVLVELDFAYDSDAVNSCNGNGVPTTQDGCDCNPGFEPSSTCLQNHGCFGKTGQYLVSDGCLECDVNHYCPDGLHQYPCPPGNFTLTTGAFQCVTDCNAAGFTGGGYLVYTPSNPANPTCVPCQPGYSCADGINKQLCSPGEYSPAFRLVSCLTCASTEFNAYSDQYGATSCTSCPPATFRAAQTAADRITDCVCQPSYWNGNATNFKQTGLPCAPCPNGANCDGGGYDNVTGPHNTSPYPQPGYWGDPNNPSEFFNCIPAYKCTGNFTCAYGYMGVFCVDCAPGFYLLGGPGGDCVQCPADAVQRQTLVVFGVFGILLAFAFVNHASSEVCALDTALLYVQLASIVQQMNFVWPYPVSILNYPFSAANFDLDFVSRDCLSSWTFQDHFFIIWFMIWILFGFQALTNLIAYVYMKRRTRVVLKSRESNRSLDLSEDPRLRAIRRWLRELFGLPQTLQAYYVYTDHQIATWLNFVRIVYNSIVIVCLQAFMCVELADGTSVLIADPSVVCGSTSQIIMVVFGALGTILYGVGLPVAFYGILRHGEHTGLKSEDQFLRRFGFLYVDFKQTKFRWELMVLLRRFTLIVIMVVSNNVWAQALFASLALVFFMALQIHYSPYLEQRINVLEGVALSSLCFYVLCGMLFTAMQPLDPADPNNFSVPLSYVLLVASLGTVFVCLLIFFKSLNDYFAVLLAERSLIMRARTEDVGMIRVLRSPFEGDSSSNGGGVDHDLASQWSNVMHGLSHDLDEDGSKKKRRMRRASLIFNPSGRPKSLFSALDQDKNNVLSKEEVLEYARNYLGLQSHEAARKIDQIFARFDVDETGQIDRGEFEQMIKAQIPNSKDAELKKTIKAKYLVEWAASNRVTPLLVALFFELDASMNSIVADDSIVSAYRDTSMAKFYRRLAEVFPFITDWLAACAQEDLEAFRRILKELNSVSDTCGTRGSFSRITVEIDRAPVVYWLLQASEQERLVFRTVFGSMCEGSKKLPMWQRLKGGGAVKGAKSKRTMKKQASLESQKSLGDDDDSESRAGATAASTLTEEANGNQGPGVSNSSNSNNNNNNNNRALVEV